MLPLTPPKKAITHLEDWRTVSIRRGQIFLIPSPGPTWKGLWLLPPAESSAQPICSLTYAITRYKVNLHIVTAEAMPAWQAFSLENLPPMPSPHLKAISLFKLQKKKL
jgi:hypothetical protein